MAYRVEDDPSHPVVRVTVEGGYDKAEVEAMVARAREASSRGARPILYDMRRASPGDMTPAEVFWLARQHPALQSADAATIRVAGLHDARFAAVATFWENAFRNSGLQARAFTDEADALRWLAGKD